MIKDKAERERIADAIVDEYGNCNFGRYRDRMRSIILKHLGPKPLEWDFQAPGIWESKNGKYRIWVDQNGAFVLNEKKIHNHGWRDCGDDHASLAEAKAAAQRHADGDDGQ